MIPNDPSTWLKDFFIGTGLHYRLASVFSIVGLAVIILFLCWLSNLLAKLVINTLVVRVVKRTTSIWDDIIMEQKVFTKLSHLAPALVIWFMAGWSLKAYPLWLLGVQRLTYIYMLVIGAVVISSFIESWYRIYLTLPISRHRPIKGYVQIIKLIVYFIFGLIIISVIFSKEVTAIIASLGVMASIILLIFKDAILGLVASIQLSVNNMVKVGDWITIPGREVDGEVTDISLTTVKVRNFDKTIITVPVYSLVSESFRNWVGIHEAGVKQVKKTLLVDLKSVKFADDLLLKRLSEKSTLAGYFKCSGDESATLVRNREGEYRQYFSSGRITNLGFFRMYVEAYLSEHPLIDKSQPIVARHREHDGNGLSLQVIAFSSRVDLNTFENVQSEILEHLLAVMKEFDLKVFQAPTGEELVSLTGNK